MSTVTWIPPGICTPPHKVGRPEQVESLCQQFVSDGWDPEQPALIGYYIGNELQLLSGSHRWAAAMQAELQHIPVHLVPLEEVQRAWGVLDSWKELMTPPKAGVRIVSLYDEMKKLVLEGWFSVSNSYRLIARLPPGKTGMQALLEEAKKTRPWDAERWVTTLGEDRSRSFWLRVHAKGEFQRELTADEFRIFKKVGGRAA